MIKESEVTKTFKERHRHCDECGVQITTMYSRSVCEYCGKDLCRRCIGHEDDSIGDYSTVYCRNCWEIGEFYRPTIEALESNIEVLYDQWKNECKKQWQKHTDKN